MKNRIPILLLILVILVTSCKSTDVPQVTETPGAEDPSTDSTPIVEGVFLNECRNCHTDKQRLIDTAKPEEVVEKESSGAG